MKIILFLFFIASQVMAQSASPVAYRYLHEGKEYSDRGELSKAQRAYLLSIKEDSNFADAYSNLGVVYYKQNAYEPAMKMFQKALALDSNLTEARHNLGVVYYDIDQVEKAISIWNDALLDINYSNRPRLHILIGAVYLLFPNVVDSGDFVLMAIDQFNQALKINPSFAEPHFWKGQAMELIPDIAGAMAEYKKAISINNAYADAYNQWGVLLFRENDPKAAREKFKKAVFYDPNKAVYHYNLGLTYLAEERISEGNEEINKAIKLNPYIENSGCPIIDSSSRNLGE